MRPCHGSHSRIPTPAHPHRHPHPHSLSHPTTLSLRGHTGRQAQELLGEQPAWTAFTNDEERETLFEDWIIDLRRREKVPLQSHRASAGRVVASKASGGEGVAGEARKREEGEAYAGGGDCADPPPVGSVRAAGAEPAAPQGKHGQVSTAAGVGTGDPTSEHTGTRRETRIVVMRTQTQAER
jgi:hypothetical protein